MKPTESKPPCGLQDQHATEQTGTSGGDLPIVSARVFDWPKPRLLESGDRLGGGGANSSGLHGDLVKFGMHSPWIRKRRFGYDYRRQWRSLPENARLPWGKWSGKRVAGKDFHRRGFLSSAGWTVAILGRWKEAKIMSGWRRSFTSRGGFESGRRTCSKTPDIESVGTWKTSREYPDLRKPDHYRNSGSHGACFANNAERTGRTIKRIFTSGVSLSAWDNRWPTRSRRSMNLLR